MGVRNQIKRDYLYKWLTGTLDIHVPIRHKTWSRRKNISLYQMGALPMSHLTDSSRRDAYGADLRCIWNLIASRLASLIRQVFVICIRQIWFSSGDWINISYCRIKTTKYVGWENPEITISKIINWIFSWPTTDAL